MSNHSSSTSLHLHGPVNPTAQKGTSCVWVNVAQVTVHVQNKKQCEEIAEAFKQAAELFGPAERFEGYEAPSPSANDDDVPF